MTLPAHYRVVCLSMYTEDLKRVDQIVDRLKKAGVTKANRSMLYRMLIATVDDVTLDEFANRYRGS